ncbi:MAG TPA: hypothetical protein VGI03_04460 [Verrucomicrobiae bacterium]
MSIAINPSGSGKEIAPDYLGLSFEMQRVLPDTNGIHFFRPGNHRLIATFKILGVKSLRIGGNTADRLTLPIPGKADVDSLFAFARAADVKVIYTLRLNHGDPSADAEMARYISRHYGNQLACFAIGNEPNVYFTNFTTYFNSWKQFEPFIVSNVPAVKFSGPGVSPGHQSWSEQFAVGLAQSGVVKIVTQHDYPGGDARKVKDPAAARDKILSPDIDEHYLKFAGDFVPAILSNGLPYRLEEANSFYDGGAKDVSDTFASSLWALDFLWWWAEDGCSGVNFHTGDTVAARDENAPCRYATFWTSPAGYNIHPIGYAEKLFSLGARGHLVPATVTNTNNVNLAVYAARSGRKLDVTLINREHGTNGLAPQITLDPGFDKSHARIIFLTMPGGDVSAKTGMTLGGADITDNARWKGKWTRLTGSSDGRYPLPLPAATAAVVEFTAD